MNDYSDTQAKYRNKRSGELYFAQLVPRGFPSYGRLLVSPVVRSPNKSARDYTAGVELFDGLELKNDGRRFEGSTPDAARHAAALAVFPSLPAATQAELGECP